MNFIESIAAHAQKVAKEYDILPSLIIAQACHESNFGLSGLAKNGKNLFGVKGSYNGSYVTMKTWEHINGKDVKVDANFRKYPSYYESMKDLCELYKKGVSWDRDKYKAVISEKDFEKAARAVEKAGYATDPYGYANKLLGIYKGSNLKQYDVPENPPYKVIIPNTAYWQARRLVKEFEDRGYKCQGVAGKKYGPNEKPQDKDPFQFVIFTDHEQAKHFVIELKRRGYNKVFGTKI